ncbi:MAG: thioredoxin-dependent thiol peroxidase [Actinomycetaceae bacterium]|nr:thioredoxin-dependent thiol peroxidase [Arcanobacterium sp.]MDD7504713.1 thioredoxin-dependent thiol peroxidase [Actinomycetaceae bacterium]MDY6143112.1 thioredoxin-dependent thiol peroxidase [Arcanobacterium sp.]
MAQFEQGDTVPDFTLDTLQGEKVNLYEMLDRAAKGVIVYFYPRAMTPGCTTEACDFRDSENSLKSAGYTVIGISPDTVESLQKFTDKESLNFPLASDPDKTVMTQWGAFGEKKNYGKIVQGVIRSTVVVDKDRTVREALYNVKATGHVARLRKLLGIDPE